MVDLTLRECLLADCFVGEIDQLKEQNAELRSRLKVAEARSEKMAVAGRALYNHAVATRIHEEWFFLAWSDKFSPDMKEEMRTLRVALFSACKRWRSASSDAS